ncbi:uncharacterized protein LOC121304601 isoform X2 [Polyodon spathula]|uniref:uncharacterized protein LOC121304601 isoform X2 n=1 Tax=Polyodon spathula TaxID=7913 RepID=UPI001B7DDA4E|nr:uncharacterized protein LOC121304601 isoform X2 [Polyodon spathula]
MSTSCCPAAVPKLPYSQEMQLVNITDYMSGKPLRNTWVSIVCRGVFAVRPYCSPQKALRSEAGPADLVELRLCKLWPVLTMLASAVAKQPKPPAFLDLGSVKKQCWRTMTATAFMRWQIPERYLKLPELAAASQVPPPSSCGSRAPPTTAQAPPTGLDGILSPPLSVQAPPLPPVQSTNGLFPAIHESQRGPKTVPSTVQRGGLTGLHKDSRSASKDGGSLVKPGTAVDTAPSVADKENRRGAEGSQQNLTEWLWGATGEDHRAAMEDGQTDGRLKDRQTAGRGVHWGPHPASGLCFNQQIPRLCPEAAPGPSEECGPLVLPPATTDPQHQSPAPPLPDLAQPA